MRAMRILLIVLVLGSAGFVRTANGQARPVAADCDRQCLRGFITQYLDAMVAHTPGALPVAASVRFTEDTVDMKLGDGLWKAASKISTHPGLHYRVVAVDEELGIMLLRINFGRANRYGVGNALIVWEAFKVFGGEIHAVEAFMKIMPAAAGSGWDTDVRRPAH